jgi:toxin-antitoxin system PIN domain toxin
VILVDANILIYAHVRSSPQHQIARRWLDHELGGTAQVGLPWASLLAFLRIVTNPRVFERPESIIHAWRQVLEWLSCEVVWTPQPSERYADVLGEFLAHVGVQANLVQDAHLAALAVEHGLIVCSADSDFARFPGLRWINPLAARRAD